MQGKLKWIIGGVILLVLLSSGVLKGEELVGWIRYAVFGIQGTAQQAFKPQPPGNLEAARVCRENLHRLQAGKRKTAFDRGQNVGSVTWEEVARTLNPGKLSGRPTAQQLMMFIPKCPSGGTYSLGTLEEVPRCSIGGNNTLTLEDDHIIRD